MQKDLQNFSSWDLIDQNNAVLLIKRIYKFNTNSRFFCTRKKKNITIKRNINLPQQKTDDNIKIQMISEVEKFQVEVKT